MISPCSLSHLAQVTRSPSLPYLKTRFLYPFHLLSSFIATSFRLSFRPLLSSPRVLFSLLLAQSNLFWNFYSLKTIPSFSPLLSLFRASLRERPREFVDLKTCILAKSPVSLSPSHSQSLARLKPFWISLKSSTRSITNPQLVHACPDSSTFTQLASSQVAFLALQLDLEELVDRRIR